MAIIDQIIFIHKLLNERLKLISAVVNQIRLFYFSRLRNRIYTFYKEAQLPACVCTISATKIYSGAVNK